MRRARDEQGFVLATAVMVMLVMMGLGLGLLMFADNQQKAAGREQASETAFDLAEAALNAQVGQLARVWPAKESEAFPSRCTAAESTATNGCPTAASLASAYNSGPQACTGTEPWGSPLSNSWTTYVRDDLEGSQIFNSTSEESAPSWDKTTPNKLWVRATGVVQCHVVTLVTLVARQLVAVSFPRKAATGNWFRVTNKGNKVIVNTVGVEPYKAGEPGEISMRCSGLGSEPCEVWEEAKEQISPNTTKSPPTASPLLSESTMEELKATAQAAGTFYSEALGNCPTSAEGAAGDPAYVECGAMKWQGNGIGNSLTSPGFLILATGTLELAGTSEFYGVIYARNPTNLSGAVVSLGGKAQVYGAIDVDGNGGIEFGSSKANLIYDPRATLNLKASVGVAPTRNTFRVLPVNQ
jgi:Tfp pilus assembly protein PilX